MGKTTGIEWTGSTWSPNKGCSRVSPGCQNCYAETLAGRFCGAGLPLEGFATRTPSGSRWTGRVELASDRLDVPVRWQSPRRIFVNSQSDTFHEKLSNEEIAAVFGAMAAAPQHTFQVLTKRSKRMHAWFRWFEGERFAAGRFVVPALIEHAAATARKHGDDEGADRLSRAANERSGANAWPLLNVHLGVSVEDQERAFERVDDLIFTRAAVKFLSIEPLLGPIDLDPPTCPSCQGHDTAPSEDPEDGTLFCPEHEDEMAYTAWLDPLNGGIDWVIVGGESGTDARPMHPDWVRSIRDQCRDASVPFFFKQWGAWASIDDVPEHVAQGELVRLALDGKPEKCLGKSAALMERVGKKAAGARLDGVEHKAFPELSDLGKEPFNKGRGGVNA